MRPHDELHEGVNSTLENGDDVMERLGIVGLKRAAYVEGVEDDGTQSRHGKELAADVGCAGIVPRGIGHAALMSPGPGECLNMAVDVSF